MRQVRQRDTAPEQQVRSALHRAGLRYVLHPRDLPGRPDIGLPRRATVVFVHGCFWHGHRCRHGRVQAKSNAEFWRAKIEGNRARDRRKSRALRALGWQVQVVWECHAGDPARLQALCALLLAR